MAKENKEETGRGIKSLLEITDPKNIIETDRVEGIPNVIIEEGDGYGWGFSTAYRGFSLKEKRYAGEKQKDENGEETGKVYKLQKWVDANCYVSSYEAIFKAYAQLRRESEISKLKGCKDMSVIQAIEDNINESIANALKNMHSDSISTTIEMEDTLRKMHNQAEEWEQLEREALKLHEQIKETRKILINDNPNKQTRHIMHLE